MATDPICGMTVDESSTLRVEREGQTFFFCSDNCRKKFVGQAPSVKSTLLAPVSKVGGKASHVKHDHSHHDHVSVTVTPSTAAKYFCPMCPGVE